MQVPWISRVVLIALLSAGSGACVVQSSGNSVIFGSGGERAERTQTLDLELRSGEQLDVDLDYGDIVVRVAEGESPRVEAHWRAKAKDKATAEALLARYKLEFVRGSDSLRVRAVGEPIEVTQGGASHGLIPAVDLILRVPAQVRLQAQSDAGDVSADGALAECQLRSSYGDVSAAGIRGPTAIMTGSGEATLSSIEASSVEAKSQYGDVQASQVRAERVRLSTASGDVAAESVDGALTAISSYGDIGIEDCSGDLEAKTSSGDISLGSPRGSARRKLSTSYGDVRVRGAQGELDAATSSGEVVVRDADGVVRAVSSYGDVAVNGRFTQLEASTNSGSVAVEARAGSTSAADWRIRSSYGDVSLRLPADFACVLEADSSTGDLDCDFAASVRDAQGKRLRRLQCTLGTGGKLVQVGTGSGDVSITALKP